MQLKVRTGKRIGQAVKENCELWDGYHREIRKRVQETWCQGVEVEEGSCIC